MVLEVLPTGWLTSWSITRVTTPLELTRASTLSVVPVLRVEIVLVKTELPPCWTPPATACEVNTGTSCPTFIVAGTLSVAMMLGDAMTRDWFAVVNQEDDTVSNYSYVGPDVPPQVRDTHNYMYYQDRWWYRMNGDATVRHSSLNPRPLAIQIVCAEQCRY